MEEPKQPRVGQTSTTSIKGGFGIVHASVLSVLGSMSYPVARRWLKSHGFTHGEQDELLRVVKGQSV